MNYLPYASISPSTLSNFLHSKHHNHQITKGGVGEYLGAVGVGVGGYAYASGGVGEEGVEVGCVVA
jgi:hypothetical protein